MSRRTTDRQRSTAFATAPPAARVPSPCLLLLLVSIHPLTHFFLIAAAIQDPVQGPLHAHVAHVLPLLIVVHGCLVYMDSSLYPVGEQISTTFNYSGVDAIFLAPMTAGHIGGHVAHLVFYHLTMEIL